MPTDQQHSWRIAGICDSTTYRVGVAASLREAWTAALAAGRTALLSGQLDDLAASIDGELEALHSPGRNRAGELDPAELTADLVETFQSATVSEVIYQLTQPSPWMLSSMQRI
jgi:hypothetical protein